MALHRRRPPPHPPAPRRLPRPHPRRQTPTPPQRRPQGHRLPAPGRIRGDHTRFDGYRGRYLFRCHNAEHEGMGMMADLEVV
ncbi:multicopper oxidase domain-containing protein [Streptomyces laurentii]|uniref:multicopper oxidase domain-containing protein n=1 Tax=Streptomyces laurentii TaxID=39478 RepID=UPI00367A3C27